MNRLKEARNYLGLTQSELADNIGQKWYKIKDIETGKNKISTDIADLLRVKYSISFDWLLTGKGEMLPSDTPQTQNIALASETIKIKKYPYISASAGTGTDNYEEEIEDIDMPTSFLKSLGITKFKNLEIITAHGNSMEPTIMDKDYLLIDRDYTTIIDDHIYIYRYSDEVYVKKLIKLKNTLKAISTNKEYETITLDKTNSLEILGKVLLTFKKLNDTYSI